MAAMATTHLTFRSPEELKELCRQLREVHSIAGFVAFLTANCAEFQPERREHSKLFTLAYVTGDTEKSYSSIISTKFWDVLWPYIVQRAEQFHALFPKGVPYLCTPKPSDSHSGKIHRKTIEIPTTNSKSATATLLSSQHIYSRAQAACLLANMLLCVMPSQTGDFNRSHWLHTLAYKSPANITKLQMILRYFDMLYEKEPLESIVEGGVLSMPHGSISLRRVAFHHGEVGGEGARGESSPLPIETLTEDSFHLSKTAGDLVMAGDGMVLHSVGMGEADASTDGREPGSGSGNPIAELRFDGSASKRRGDRDRAALDGADGEFWGMSTMPLAAFNMRLGGTIEDAPSTAIRGDFANEYIGGGVLGQGAVQEEIMFVEAPELLISCVLCPVMLAHEVIYITGAPRLFTHTGYANTFTYAGVCDAPPTFAEIGTTIPEGLHPSTAAVTIVAMDATPYPRFVTIARQIAPKAFHRELTKAFTAFALDAPECALSTFHQIATGKWGCGAFNGSKVVKLLVQWLAACQARREMIFYAFGDEELAKMSEALLDACAGRGLTVGQLYQVLRDVEDEVSSSAAAALRTGKDTRKDLLSEQELFDLILTRIKPAA